MIKEQVNENDKKKNYLNSYKEKTEKLRSLEEQLRGLHEIETSAKAQNYSDMPKGNKQTDLSDFIVRLENLESKVMKQKYECMDIRLNIMNSICDMSKGIESTILYKKYIEFKQWEQICIEVGYSWRQVHRIHSDALNNYKMAHNGT